MAFEKVSIIIPTYNYAHFIGEAIESVLEQSYPNEHIEIIIVDDGSVDNTRQVVQPFIANNGVQYFYQENKGKANATQKAIDLCSGKYIFNLDADDYFYKDKIAASVRIFEKYPSVVHVASPADFIEQSTDNCQVEKLPSDILEKYLDGDWLLNRFYQNNILFGGGTTFAARASVLKAIHIPSDVDMYIDEFLILAVLAHGGSYFNKEPLSAWRVHENNYSGNGAPDEKYQRKAKRLLDSSKGVLHYLEENCTDQELIKIYRLQDATRRISYFENINTKTIKDIISYGKEVFFDINPRWNLVKKYKVINRLIPSSIFRLLKKVNSQ